MTPHQRLFGKRQLLRVILFTMMCCSVVSTSIADFQRTKIAVLDFELTGEKQETTGMSSILSEWFSTSIVRSGRFDVVERAMLQKIVSEQKLTMTGFIDNNSATELGKILGVNMIITGSVLKQQNSLDINSRVFSVESGSIIAAESIHGDAGSDLHGLVDELTGKIIRNFPLTGYVVKKNPNSVVIDLGLDSGLAPGTEFIVYREGEAMKHPKTGEVLDVEKILTGRVEITKVSRNVAEGEIVNEESGGIEYGQLVKSVQKEAGQAPSRTTPKSIAAVSVTSPPQVAAPAPAPPARLREYKAALFPWDMLHDADGFAEILTDKIEYRIEDIPNLTLTKSYYEVKRVERLSNVSSRQLLDQSGPNLPLLRQKGEELGVDVAILGKLDIHCRWSDNCQVRGIKMFIVDLTTGNMHEESGFSWDIDARDYIDKIVRKGFVAFASTIRQ